LMKLTVFLTLSALVRGSLTRSDEFREKCTSLGNSLNIPGARATLAQFVANGTTLDFPDSDASCTRPSQTVSTDLCRIALRVATSNRSGISMEAWLPVDWSGRFLSTGNGGLGGCIQYEDIEYAASLGFAAVGTNNGHDGMTGQSFLNNTDVIEDFAYRALHTGVVVGKQISQAFYGEPHKKSYYLGCSTGGRQGFKEAQSFPDDFDGIVAGAPAFSFNNLTSWSSNFLVLTGAPGSATFVPTSMWPTIHEDILAQCDELDGARDGVLESPDLCNYDPSGLICASNTTNSTTCLTETQAQTVRSIFSPLLDPQDGSLVYPALQPGAETTGALETYFLGQPFGASDWFKYALFRDPTWDPATLTPADWVASSRANLFNIETWEGDLSRFERRGGKLLHYHGLVDGTISSNNSPRYYEHVSATMGLAPRELDAFYRLFRISGMAHCGGGPGATFIGNQKQSVASLEPEENVLMAMVRWVEEGVPPEVVRGTAYVNGSRDAGVAFKRNHCRWPYRNVYKGPGDVTDEAAWEC
ncbi:Tannase/feruloyl esterase, partial [Macrophomina phaseolina]